MYDDTAKLQQKRGVRKALVDDELARLRGFLAMVIEFTPYGAKRVAYTPAIAAIRSPSLLAEFVARCRAARIDVELDAGSAQCAVAIHAPDPTPASTSPASCTRRRPHRTA
jgi:hypothetical protein